MSKEDLICGAVDVIITTRDFCGNEKEAVNDFLADEGVPRKDRMQIYRIANYRANAAWNGFKREAGVNEKYLF